MAAFRLLLIALTALIVPVTLMALAHGGPDLVTPFLGSVFEMSWQGQFNIDFAGYLVLSGIWMAWRSGFSRAGLILGICAPPLGMLFLAPYLVYLIGKSGGDPRVLLLGVHAERQTPGA